MRKSPAAAQLRLFEGAPKGPEGLLYQPDFITPAEENGLVSHLQTLPLTPFQFGAFEGKRRVAWFGWQYDYSKQKLEPAAEFPNWLMPIIAKVEAFAGLPASSVRQVLCTEYETGVGIGWHRDKPQFEQIFGLSLVSACKFRFRRKSAAAWERFTLDAMPRSLYMMSGAARHAWEHSIPAVDALRYSVTFRTMADGK
jgi:alkylated DNA repair dioxygenase AlkB